MKSVQKSTRACLLTEASHLHQGESFSGGVSQLLFQYRFLYDPAAKAFFLEEKDDVLFGIWSSRSIPCSPQLAHLLCAALSKVTPAYPAVWIYYKKKRCQIALASRIDGECLEFVYYFRNLKQSIVLHPALTRALFEAVQKPDWPAKIGAFAGGS
jgi:hypothetical protein